MKILAIPRPLLYSAILVFATLGVYSLANSLVDVLIMYLIGVIGFFMRRYDFPVGPMILGVILGPLLERQFRNALQISQGDLTIFITRPISAILLLAAVAALVLPYLPSLLGQPVAVEHRPGASGAVGTRSVARAAVRTRSRRAASRSHGDSRRNRMLVSNVAPPHISSEKKSACWLA